jgi:hypothetical protein
VTEDRHFITCTGCTECGHYEGQTKEPPEGFGRWQKKSLDLSEPDWLDQMNPDGKSRGG